MTKIDLCNRIIEAIEVYRPSNHATSWASDIDKDTAERVITVIQNVVRGVRDSRQKVHSKGKPPWIPVSQELPKVKQRVIVTLNDGSMAMRKCNDAGHLTWYYSNIKAWMPAPEPYEEEDE